MLDSCGTFLSRGQVGTHRKRAEIAPARSLALRRPVIVWLVTFPGSLTLRGPVIFWGSLTRGWPLNLRGSLAGRRAPERQELSE